MPNTKSAAKRLRQNTRRRVANRSVRSEVRTRYRKAVEAATGPDAAQAPEVVRESIKRVDQAAAKGVIHKNAAARMKSRLAAKMKKAGVKLAPAQGG